MQMMLKGHQSQIREMKKQLQADNKEQIKKLEKEIKSATSEFKEKLKSEAKSDSQQLKLASKDAKKKLEAEFKEREKGKEIVFNISEGQKKMFQEKRLDLHTFKKLSELEKIYLNERMARRIDDHHKVWEALEGNFRSFCDLEINGLEGILELKKTHLGQQESSETNQMKEQQQTEVQTNAKNEPKLKEQFRKDIKLAKKQKEAEIKKKDKEEMKEKKRIVTSRSQLKDLEKHCLLYTSPSPRD
eukprot:TRINITY_DN5065_c0_g1_i1.p1 TRINITY_DN5065_c0_g1~~TRINITY_DN5065_c0_g1_i1.p1  ORF type:complete len:272 (-),score=120.16 TRINITY_DN5065_c0_g1_i1:30-761(-)